MEGLLPYLPEAEVERLLKRMRSLSAAGSFMGADHPSNKLFAMTAAKGVMNKLNELKAPLVSSTYLHTLRHLSLCVSHHLYTSYDSVPSMMHSYLQQIHQKLCSSPVDGTCPRSTLSVMRRLITDAGLSARLLVGCPCSSCRDFG